MDTLYNEALRVLLLLGVPLLFVAIGGALVQILARLVFGAGVTLEGYVVRVVVVVLLGAVGSSMAWGLLTDLVYVSLTGGAR